MKRVIARLLHGHSGMSSQRVGVKKKEKEASFAITYVFAAEECDARIPCLGEAPDVNLRVSEACPTLTHRQRIEQSLCRGRCIIGGWVIKDLRDSPVTVNPSRPTSKYC